jgi:putative methylase
MGKPSQERLVRKLDLERFLAQIEPNPAPKAILEQYTISEHVAADILYLAAYGNDDVVNKSVLDLGCGTGRLALGAAFLGATNVVGVDIDRAAVVLAAKNAERTRLNSRTGWIVSDVDAVKGRFDTVLQNPPFGVQKRGADRKFLSKALEVGSRVYSLHNHPETDEHLISKLKGAHGTLLRVEPSSFIKRYVEERGGTVLAVYSLLMRIPRLFDFHTKTKHEFIVDLYVVRKDA